MKNYFESEDSILEMVTAAESDLAPDKVRELYQTICEKIRKNNKENDFWRARMHDNWHIEIKKSVARLRDVGDILLDLANLWVKSGNDTRDDICRILIGVSHDNVSFYKLFECYQYEFYTVEIPDADKDSVFSSVVSLKKALDEAIDDERFRMSIEDLTRVYKYIAFGYNRVMADKELRNRLKEMRIETDAGFCRLFHDVVICYNSKDNRERYIIDEDNPDNRILISKEIELQRIFYYGIPWDALIFNNAMSKIYRYILKNE